MKFSSNITVHLCGLNTDFKGHMFELILKSKTVKFEANCTDWDIAVDSVVISFAAAQSAADSTSFRVTINIFAKRVLNYCRSYFLWAP